MRVLGIDPGSAVVGYGVVEPGAGPSGSPGGRLVECGVVRADARAPLPERLRTIHDGLAALIARHRPDVLAVEGIFYAKNVRTTVVLGHARGVILLAAAQAGLPVSEYAPRVVKRTIVGKGGALKAQVGYMVAQLLRLKAPPKPADAADAVAIALTHLLVTQRGAAFFRRVTGAR
ncbi:MAG TPA: crossover junction endodeoxyribonuclease RuvC [Gemmatimonadales bacterium]|nr:crossover junction endodeoxyribonuclease RuvC [Gemmatimonadales bacterium]